MRLEATYRTSADVKERWGHDVNLRAELKMQLAEVITMKMRMKDLIDFVVSTDPDTGETIITASILAERTGDEK